MEALGLFIVRQAGSAAGLVPIANHMMRAGYCRVIKIIAFPQAQASCREVAEGLPDDAIVPVTTDDEARALFNEWIAGAGFLITGTSAEAENDAWFWRTAREYGVRSVGYLDQWVNIDLRFPGPTAHDWPDHLSVIDEHDKKLAQEIAPEGVGIEVTGSSALENIKRQVAQRRAGGVKADPQRILFATEPMADQQAFRRVNGCNDEDSFVLALQLLRQRHPKATLVMRLHPRDTQARWLDKLPQDLVVEWDSDSRADSLAKAGKVFGMRSFFLLEAAAAGVPVYSLQPARSTPCPLTDGRMPVILAESDYRPVQ